MEADVGQTPGRSRKLNPRVLILSASTGSGHQSASIALQEEIRSRGGTAEVVDCMDHVSKKFRRWFKGGYEMLVKNQPWFWGYLYKTSDRPLFNYGVQTLLDWKCCYPLDDVVRDFRPDVVLCAHSVAQPRLPALRKELGFATAVVVTDLYPHRMWLRGDPDLFFVPTEESCRVLRRRLGEKRRPVHHTGIPVNRAFRRNVDPAAVRSKFGLPADRPLVLLSSGGIGAGPFDDAVAALLGIEAHLAALCGRSQEAYDSLRRKFGGQGGLTILGPLEQPDMGALMGSADLLIGKSGGLTTFEALACGLPFLVLLPFLIPGQEEDNADWLQTIGAGQLVEELSELRPTVDSLLADPALLAAMREAALKHARPEAARAIVDHLWELCSARQQVEVLGSQ